MSKFKSSLANSYFEAARLPQLSGILAYGVLLLVLLFAQTTELVHSHDGDLSKQADCEICLKLGSTGDAVIVHSLELRFDPFVAFYPEVVNQLFTAAILAPRSRAPPQA